MNPFYPNSLALLLLSTVYCGATTHFEYTQLKIGLGFAEVILNNANCQTVETFQRATSSYFGEGIAKKKVTYE